MTRIRRINVSQVEGGGADSTDTNEIRPNGETAFYLDDDNRLTLMMFDGVRTHLKSKVVGPGVLYGSNADSGDGNNYDTIKLIPDTQRYFNDGNFGNDQYIIVDPTQPDHIHIRAGGTIDNSNAALFLGGENSNVEIQAGENPPVFVRSNSNTWMFDVDGSLTFPDGTTQTTSWTGSVDWNNVTNTPTISSVDTGNITFDDNAIQGNPLGTVGTKITVNSNYIGSTSQNSNVFNLTKNADTDQVQIGWVIRGSGGGGQTVTNKIDNSSYWSFYVGSGTQTEFPITIESADYQVGSDPQLILIVAPDGVAPKSWTFDTDGDLTFPDGTTQATAYVPEDNLVKVSGEWTVTAGTNTYSFTVPSDGTYIMWVKGNIPNGIITWNATASVSNTNVPAIGTQYAWNYTGGESPIALTSIPDQIKGVAGTISTDATYAGTTSNRFDFGISNTSGSTQTIYYGYTKIS